MDTRAYIEEKNRNNFISTATKNIDAYIKRADFKAAFTLFLLTMERLNHRERQEFIDFYTLQLIT